MMNLNELTPEQIEKLQACTTLEELRAFVEGIGQELTVEELDAFAGGADLGDGPDNTVLCPFRGISTHCTKLAVTPRL